MSLTDTERKELAKEVVDQIKAADNGDCRLFSRKEVNDLRQFANHWNKHADDYRSLVEFGQSLRDTKKRAWAAIIWIMVSFLLFVIGWGLVHQIEKMLER